MSPAEENSPTPSDEAGQDLLSEAYFRDRDIAKERAGPGASFKEVVSKALLRVVPILLLLGAIDIMVQRFFPPEELLPYMQREAAVYTLKTRLFQEKPAPDLLVLGSSRIRDAVNPKVFMKAFSKRLGRPVRVYNLGLPGAKIEEYYALATSHMPHPPPPYMVIGFSGSEIAQTHSFQYASHFLWRFPNLVSYLRRTGFVDLRVNHVEYYLESLLCRLWYLFEQRDALSRLLSYHLSSFFGFDDMAGEDFSPEKQKIFINHVLAEDGYQPFLHKGPPLDVRLREDPASIQLRDIERLQTPGLFQDSSKELLKLIVRAFQEQGSRVALIEAPTSPYLQQVNPVLYGEGFRSWMNHVAEELGVLFLSFPVEETAFTNADFEDTNHLSWEGAKRYTRLLVKKLDSAGFFHEQDQ